MNLLGKYKKGELPDRETLDRLKIQAEVEHLKAQGRVFTLPLIVRAIVSAAIGVGAFYAWLLGVYQPKVDADRRISEAQARELQADQKNLTAESEVQRAQSELIAVQADLKVARAEAAQKALGDERSKWAAERRELSARAEEYEESLQNALERERAKGDSLEQTAAEREEANSRAKQLEGELGEARAKNAKLQDASVAEVLSLAAAPHRVMINYPPNESGLAKKLEDFLSKKGYECSIERLALLGEMKKSMRSLTDGKSMIPVAHIFYASSSVRPFAQNLYSAMRSEELEVSPRFPMTPPFLGSDKDYGIYIWIEYELLTREESKAYNELLEKMYPDGVDVFTEMQRRNEDARRRIEEAVTSRKVEVSDSVKN